MSVVHEYKHTSWSENYLLCVQLKARADAAIADLEAKVEQYKWQRDELKRELALDLEDGRGLSMMSMASGAIGKELDRRWDHREDPDV